MMACNKFAEFLQKKLFSHIKLQQLSATKVNILKPFIRSDLALKSWQALNHQKSWIGQASISVNRDSIFIAVKDINKPTKQLVLGSDDALLQKYASAAYVEHLLRKGETAGAVAERISSQYDALLAESQGNVYSNVQSGGPKKETGIKIQTGLGYQKKEENKKDATEGSHNDQDKLDELIKKNQAKEEDEECDLGALF